MKKIIPLVSVFMLLFMACPPKDGEEVAITLSPTTLELKVGETGALTASVTPAQAKIAGVKWSSSNTAVASVSSGTVTGVGEGTATITAESVQDPSKKASASVTVINPYKDGFTISGDDFYNVNPMQTEVRFMLFNETDRFLNMVKECFPAAESAGFKYNDIIVKNIDAAENSLVTLTDSPLFTVDSPLSANSFAVEKTAAVEPATEYTKKFALDLEVGGRTVKVTWVDSEGDVFTTPNEGEITFSASDVVYSVSEERKISGTVNNLATKLTAAGVTVDSGTVAVKITVGDQSVTTTAAAPTDSIAWNIDHAFDEGASLSLTVELIFNGYNPAPVVAYQGFPVELTVQKSVVITPLEISLNRKTSTRGVPEAKLIAQFSYPDMEVLLDGADYLNGAYADYDFENATWSARFADADSAGTAVATFENAPYGEPAETGLDLSKEYKLKLMDGTLTVPAKAGGSVSFPLTWSSDALLGDSILIKHEAEFPEKLYFNASDNFTPRTEKKDGDTEYILVFGDDFNYTYNGLNYKSYAEWNEAKRSGDTKGITEFSRIWTTENENNAFTRRQATWDMRSAEVKNSHLFQKVMASDPASGTIYLGANTTKPLKGFTDLNQAGTAGGSTKAGEVLTGSVISDFVTYGYTTARVRTKAKGYNGSKVLGPWYAFWAHGPMHEFDIMEQLPTNPNQYCNVNHYHNNWGSYGGQQNSKFYNTITMTNSDVQQNYWTLGLFWNQTNYAYYYNDQAYTKIYTDDNQLTAKRTVMNISGATIRKEYGEEPSHVIGNTGTSYSEAGYTGTLKAVPSAPVNIFVSTEAGGSWGGANLSADTKRNLPTWLEVDYVAYYLPNVEVSAVTISQKLKEKYATVFTTTPSFTLTAEVTPNDVPTKDVIWSSDNPQAVEISADGTVTIVGSGTATIKAVSVMDETKSDSFTITVSNDKVSVDSVAIEGNDSINLDYMGTTTLTVTISPDNASVKNVEWTVAPEGIVELENADTETVTVNAVGSGTATITVTSVDNPEATDSVSVTIAPPTAPATFEAHGTTFDKVDSLEFSGDDGALPDYAAVEEVSGGEGRITFSGGNMVVNAGTKTKLVYTPQSGKDFDFVLVHASYAGGTPNAYINNFDNGTGLPHLQYIRDSNKLQVWAADWTSSSDTDFTFSGDPSLYGIYADSGTYAFAVQKNCYKSEEIFEALKAYSNAAFGSTKLEFVFEGSGTVRIDYIGFYKAQNTLVDTSRTGGQKPTETIARGGKNYTLVSTLFEEGNNGISLTDYLGAAYIEDGSLLKITQQDTSTEETMDLPANGENVSYIELRVKLSSASASPHLGLTWRAQFFRNNLGGNVGGGLACGIGAQTAINPTDGVYSLYGIALSETAGGELVFFFDGVEKASGKVDKDLQDSVVKGLDTYPFFYTFDSGSGAWFEIDYIAFYTDSQ